MSVKVCAYIVDKSTINKVFGKSFFVAAVISGKAKQVDLECGACRVECLVTVFLCIII